MTNILAFRRPAAPAGSGACMPHSCDILRFTSRPAARSSRLVAAWRLGDHNGRLECHWQLEGDETAGKDVSRRPAANLPEIARRRIKRRLAGGAGAALCFDHAGRSPTEVP